ncbi:MAG: hypothetical protein V1917_00200 [Candidatus Gottesmanbacteria bacterium]
MNLKKKTLRRHTSMLPIDERLIPDVFSFSHVKGVARMFLIAEILLSTLVVIGTLILILLHAVSL